ncbi:MAG: hypothetical protein ABI239_06860 [Aquihabitans sp.]
MTVVATVALFAFHLWSTRHLTGPSVVFDESGYLGSARWLAGGSRWDMPTSPSYAVGYPVLLAPVMAVFHTADAQWQAVMVVNAALLASLFPWMTVVFQRVLGLPRHLALLGAGVGALAPCVVAAGGSAIAENLVLPLIPATMLATWALTESGRPRRRGWVYAFGPLVALLLVTHPRFTLVAPVGLVALALGVWRGSVNRSVAIVNALLLMVVAGAGTALDRMVRHARWNEVESLQGGPRDWLQLLANLDGVRELALTAVGQIWYLAAGSLGLSMVGIWYLLGRTTGRSEPPIASTSTAPTSRTEAFTKIETETERDRRFAVGFLLAAAATVFVTSVLFFAQNQFRADHWVYGRHNDSFTPLWVGVGVIALVGTVGLRRRLTWLAGSFGVVAASGLLVWATRDSAELKNEFSVFAVPALSRLAAHDPSTVFQGATVVAAVAIFVLASIVASADRWDARPTSHRAMLLVIPLLLAPFFAWTGYGTIVGTETFRDYLTDDWSAPQELERLGVTTLEVEGRTARGLPSLLYPFALPGVDVTIYDAQQTEPTGPFVVARVDDPMRQASGDRLVLIDSNLMYNFWDAAEGIGIWVRPGPDHDRLAAAGLLLPAEFPTALPIEARSADLVVAGGLGDDGTLRLAAGAAAALTVTGRHTGDRSPWPDVASSGPGRVEVKARVEPDDRDGSAGIGSGGELDRWVRPGQEFTSEVTIRAIGPLFADLAPGRYTVHLGVGQNDDDGELWFASGGPEASFPLVVT